MGEKQNKDKLMAIARLIVDTCTPEEMNMLCIGILDANLKLKAEKKRRLKQCRNL